MTGMMMMASLATTERIIATYEPLDWQEPVWRCKDRVVLLTGSAGGGKSRVAAEKVHGFCHRYEGAMALILRKTRSSMTNSTALMMERLVIGADPQVTHYPSKSRFEYANGSILAYGGMANDEQREKVRSIGQEGGVDIAWMEEATEFIEDDYNEINARMRGNAAGWRQVILTTNPGPPRHWIYNRLIQGHEATVFYSKATDNPYNPDDYKQALDSLTGVLRDRLRDGQWRAAEGVIYDEFDYALHVRERPISEMAEWLAAVDEGFTNPAVILVIGKDGDGRAHVAEEFYRSGVLQQDFVKECSRVSIRYGQPIFYVDPSAAGLIAALKAAGLRAREADNTVYDGIQTVKGALATAADGKPRLTIDPTCVNLIGEFGTYSWEKDRMGTQRDKPIKLFDHAEDSLRYGLHSTARKRHVLIAGV